MEYIFIFGYIAIFVLLAFLRDKTAFYYLGLASLVSLAWVFFANNQYGYNNETLMIFGLNSYPLFGFAVGLFIFISCYEFIINYLNVKRGVKQIIFIFILYWFLLLSAETIWYHVFGVQNVATGTYSGLPICDCLHAPVWMQAAYLFMGPVYLIFCELGKEWVPKFIRE